MNRWLWILQVLLAVAFLAHGLMMLFPPASVAEQMNATLPRWFSLFLGVAEVAAAVGLTLPGMTRVLPRLGPMAAVGIMIVMISATIYHLMRAEWSSSAVTFVLLLMAGYVAYMRWRVMPLRAKGSGL